jgi:hypothetical protein
VQKPAADFPAGKLAEEAIWLLLVPHLLGCHSCRDARTLQLLLLVVVLLLASP